MYLPEWKNPFDKGDIINNPNPASVWRKIPALTSITYTISNEGGIEAHPKIDGDDQYHASKSHRLPLFCILSSSDASYNHIYIYIRNREKFSEHLLSGRVDKPPSSSSSLLMDILGEVSNKFPGFASAWDFQNLDFVTFSNSAGCQKWPAFSARDQQIMMEMTTTTKSISTLLITSTL